MSSPEPSTGTLKPAGLFEDLWRQLGECHHNALQELEAKVSKLKKERCLDAQRLELFHNRIQQLKEQNKALQERPCEGACEQCVISEENLKNSQDQNLRIITKLKNEKKSLEDENRKLRLELQTLKLSMLRHESSSEQEDGVIPDSPVLHSSLPVANKLKKCRNPQKLKHIRYEEIPLPKSNKSLFKEVDTQAGDATQNPGRAEVLVPNTCELDIPQFSDDVDPRPEDTVAETCAFELFDKRHTKPARTAGRQSPKSPPKYDARSNKATAAPPRLQRSLLSSTLIQSPNSTSDGSPSLLQRVKRFSEDVSINQAKRKKEESESEVQEETKQGTQEDPIPQRTAAASGSQSSKKEPADVQVHTIQNATSSQRPNASCPSQTFKKPNTGGAAKRNSGGTKRSPLHDLNAQDPQRQYREAGRMATVEPMWSIDPALQLSMYDSEQRDDEEDQQCYEDLEDTDCTWVSHSVLRGRGQSSPDRTDNVAGLGAKANDSLEMMFDTTAYGEYNSCGASRFSQSQPRDEDHNEEDKEEDDDEQDPFDSPSPSKEQKSKNPTFAHMAVFRKKDERRKLKGTTCKECEVYYAHLPEEEKQKKLSSCSRHRYLYIPPCTPENFWEVGFPSTQTCIERGYIKEESSPEARPRRRQPYNALFSPKRKQQQQS